MGHVISDLLMRWPHARIPYEVDPALSSDAKRMLNDAIFFWNNIAGVLLVPRADEPDYAFYRADIHDSGEWGGHSSTGRVGGKQDIRMDFEWSEAVGGLLHETGHTAGLLHEHQRPDRGQFVTPPDHSDADNQIINTGIMIGPYDCRSLMHYYIHSWARDEFRTKVPGRPYPFRGVTLSDGDKKALQSLYWGCFWVAHGIAATDMSVGADGSVWVIGDNPIGANFSIHRWDGVQWHQLPDAGFRISASFANSAWMVDFDRNIFEWVINNWVRRPGGAQVSPLALTAARGRLAPPPSPEASPSGDGTATGGTQCQAAPCAFPRSHSIMQWS